MPEEDREGSHQEPWGYMEVVSHTQSKTRLLRESTDITLQQLLQQKEAQNHFISVFLKL